MRVILERSNLLKSLARVQRVVERRNTIPVLSNVLLKANESNITIKATDLDIEAMEVTAAQVEKPNSTTIPAHMFHDIIRKLSDGSEVMLDADYDNRLMSISSGKSRFNLPMLPSSDFPDMTEEKFDYKFSVSCQDLKRLIDHTQFAISNEETRYYLNGIYIHTVNDESSDNLLLRAVATDGHRLARTQISAPAGCKDMPGVIIPKKAIGEIQKIVEDPKENVEIQLSEAKIRVSINNFILTSKLIDGTFPNYASVIPDTNDRKLVADKLQFATAVDRVSTISSDQSRSVKLSLDNNQLILNSNNLDLGSATEQVSVNYEAENLEIGFNARYLLDITSQVDSSKIVFFLSDSGSPALIKGDNNNDSIFVLMPMRI